MISEYDPNTYATLSTIATERGVKDVAAKQVLVVLGVNPVEHYRAPGQRRGRPQDLYLRTEVEAAYLHAEAFRASLAANRIGISSPAEDLADAEDTEDGEDVQEQMVG